MVRVGEYDLGEEIGRGTYSKVRMAHHRTTGTQYVAKIISRAQNSSDLDVRREIAILRRVRHDNVVRLIEILESPNNYYIILEPVLGGDLCDYIIKYYPEGMPAAEAQRLFSQLVSGMATCHGVGVAHRDLKPENLLITGEGGQIKISDFGLSRLHRHSQHAAQPHEYAKTVTGTLAYLAPEVLEGPYDAFKADMWSIGCVLYIMCTGRFPFGGLVGPELEERILNGAVDPLPRSVDSEAADLIQRLLRRVPEERLTLPEVANHSFLRGGEGGADGYVQVHEEDHSPEGSMVVHGVPADETNGSPSPARRRAMRQRAEQLRTNDGADSDD